MKTLAQFQTNPYFKGIEKTATNIIYMYISSRAALTRNLGVALLNGAITLIILLIAPLGLTAVIINTILVTVASFVNATAGDTVVKFLQPSQIKTMIENSEFRIQNSESKRF